MSTAQLEIWPEQQRDEWDVLTATVDGGVVWRRYGDRKIEIFRLLLSYPTLIVFPPSSGGPPRLDEALAAIGVHLVLGLVTQ
jgi:hypothetical protein